MADERVITELIVEGAQKFIQDFANAGKAVAELTTQLVNTSRIRTPQLAPDIDRITESLNRASQSATQFVDSLSKIPAQQDRVSAASERTTKQLEREQKSIEDFRNKLQASASQGAATRDNTFVQGIRQQLGVVNDTAAAHGRKTQAIRAQTDAEGAGARGGITYLSVLSAIHAASFLVSNNTFTLAGSFLTLGLAAGKLGVGFGVAGIAVGGALAIFGQVNNAMQLITSTVEATVTTLLKLGAAGAVAAIGLGGAGVKLAADVETQLASVRAFGGATTDQLKEVEAQAGQFARTFGVSAASVVEATSLFSRAGGTVKEAIEGATEAIVKLQIASQGEITAAQAALAVSAAIKQFGLTGADATRVVDQLTAAAQSSALSFTGVTQAFIQAAPGARTFGISLEDLSAGIALVGDQLVKGTITGTAFKQFLLDLINPGKKAEAELNQLGVFIKDAAGNVRPFIDILDDLFKGLEKLGPANTEVANAERAKAIAVVFGSRASLAANILTREGADALQKYREQLAAVSASNIVNILLLPLNKQLERIKTNAQEVGRSFGGPLLEPAKTAIIGIIDVLNQLRPAAELAGKAVSVIATGVGFEALQTAITDLVGNNALSSFLIELVNSFLNVRDVITNQIVPAVQDFVRTLFNAGNADSELKGIGTTFDGINQAIQRVGIIAGVAIRQFALLVVEFVKGEGRGGELRQQILNIATALATHLVTSISTTIVFLTVAAATMIKFGEIGTQVAAKLSDVFQFLANVFDAIGNTFDTVGLKAQKASLAVAKAQALNAQDFEEAIRLGKELDKIEAQIARPQGQSTLGTASLELSLAAQNASKFSDELTRLLDPDKIISGAEATAAGLRASIGEIPDVLSNVTAEIDKVQERAATPRGTPTIGVPVVDQAEIDKAVDKVEKAARTLNVKLANLQEDSQQKLLNLTNRALDKIGDIFDALNVQLEKQERELKDRIDDINSALTLRRDERSETNTLKDRLDQQLKDKQLELDAEALAESRKLDNTRLLRSRDNEDAARSFEQQVSDSEHAAQQQQQAAERALQNVQKAREQALTVSQNAEEKALQSQLNAQRTQRDNALKLSQAKTPQEVAKVNTDIAAAAADTRFQEGQQAQLDALKARHDSQRQALQAQGELQQQTLRATQDAQTRDLRLKNEQIVLTFRRRAEDVERGIRESEENTALAQRLTREQILFDVRKDHEQQLQDLQDKHEDQAAQRQIDKANRDAAQAAQDAINRAVAQAQEVIATTQQQVDENTASVNAHIRNIHETFESLKEGLPPEVVGAVLGNLTAAEAELTKNAELVRDSFEKAGVASIELLQQRQEDLQASIKLPSILTTPPTGTVTQATPTGVLNAQTLIAASVVLPGSFTFQLAQAFAQVLEGTNLQPNFEPVTDFGTRVLDGIDGLRRALGQ